VAKSQSNIAQCDKTRSFFEAQCIFQYINASTKVICKIVCTRMYISCIDQRDADGIISGAVTQVKEDMPPYL